MNKLQLVILGVVIVCGAQNNAMESLKRSCGTETRDDGAKFKALMEKKHKIECHNNVPMYYDSPCGSGRAVEVSYGNEGRFYEPNQSLKSPVFFHGCP